MGREPRPGLVGEICDFFRDGAVVELVASALGHQRKRVGQILVLKPFARAWCTVVAANGGQTNNHVVHSSHRW